MLLVMTDNQRPVVAPTEPKSPRFGVIAAAGIRALLKVSAFAAW